MKKINVMKNFSQNIKLINFHLTELEAKIQYKFRKRELLFEALTHPSYVAEYPESINDNQRLEFLGDAVLQLAVADILFEKFSDFAEGKLTKLRSVLIKDVTLADFARRLGLGNHLLMGKGETLSGGGDRKSNLEDCFEALIGAIFLDSDYDTVKGFCADIIKEDMKNIDGLLFADNPKGKLQEYTQEKFQKTPHYRLVEVVGAVHAPLFKVEVVLGKKLLAYAEGGSKKEAEKLAACEALRLFMETEQNEK